MRPLENPGRVSGHERNLKAGMHVQKRGGSSFSCGGDAVLRTKTEKPSLAPGLNSKIARGL
jgi:hypothetical protein